VCQRRFLAPTLHITHCAACLAVQTSPTVSTETSSRRHPDLPKFQVDDAPASECKEETGRSSRPAKRPKAAGELTVNARTLSNEYLNPSCISLQQRTQTMQPIHLDHVDQVQTVDKEASVEEIDDSDDEEMGSEAGDELRCTQIVDLLTDCIDENDEPDSEDEWAEDVPLYALVPANPRLPLGMKPTKSKNPLTTHVKPELMSGDGNKALRPVNDDGDGFDEDYCRIINTFSNDKNGDADTSMTCMMCGKSLQHLKTGIKGRLTHIKRCSKKDGVTARDIRLDDDHEVFAMNQKSALSPTTKLAARSVSIANPYKQPSEWHCDSNRDLDDDRLSRSGTASSSENTLVVGTGGIPQRSAFGVLLAGARRAAKVAQISATKKTEKQRARGGWRNGNGRQYQVDYSARSCPLYKKITGTDFVCDGFHYARSSLTQNYFLTHFHSDHYGGISKAWNAGTIYCSFSTANLVNQQLGVDRKFLHPLPMMTPIVVASRGNPVTVTLLDANHCPGAVMFLFEVGNRRILHVGDFRWNREIMQAQGPLRPFFDRTQNLDEIFLDTTYCDPKYSLPDQQEAIKETVKVAIEQVGLSKRNKDRTLMLFGAYTIGKERIYLSVAEKLGLKVFVDSRRYRILKALEWPSESIAMLTTRPEETILWVVPLGHINMKKMGSYLSVNTKGFSREFDRVVGFRPTGWSLSSKGTGTVKTSTKGKLTVCSVPYSEHSSFPELLDCLECLAPRKIVPTVSVSKTRQQIELLLKGLKKELI
jgi:DNA cross-link repair 1A protein